MSYDLNLRDKKGNVVRFKKPQDISGGTYALGGTTEAWLNITYNYGQIFRKVLGEKGIRTLYGMSAIESMPLLKKAISKLGDDVSDNYWDATEGNAKEALKNCVRLAQLSPANSVWDGD